MSTVFVMPSPRGTVCAVFPRGTVGRVVEKPPDGVGKKEGSDEPEKSPQMRAEGKAGTEANIEDAKGQHDK